MHDGVQPAAQIGIGNAAARCDFAESCCGLRLVGLRGVGIARQGERLGSDMAEQFDDLRAGKALDQPGKILRTWATTARLSLDTL